MNNNNIQFTEFEIFRALSGNFICKTIPDNWQELDEEERDKFVKENIWFPIAFCESSEILGLIHSSSSAMIKLLKEKGIEVFD